MIILKFYVKGQRLFPKSDLRRNIIISSGTVDQIKCKFEFDDSWDGFEKRVSFKNMNYNITKEVLPDAEGYCYIPWEVIAHTGVILCTVTGTSIADFPARLTSSTVKFYLVVRNEGVHDSTITTDPSPSEYEQFILRVYEDAQSANAAKLAAIEAQVHAELAEARIRDMTATAIAGAETDPPNVVKTDYGDHFNLEFTIPAGHSPVVTASKTEGVTTFSVDGEPVATVNDGIDGQDGVDGYSPIATVEKSGDTTTTITITDNNGTTTADVYDGVQNIWFATCSTSSSATAKIATTVSGDFELVEGNMVRVAFSYGNAYDSGPATLNVDNTGAITIQRELSYSDTKYCWKDHEVVDFVYNGSAFVMSGEGRATTSYYGVTKLSSSVSSSSDAVAATPLAVKTAYDLANSKQDALVSGTNIKTVNNTSLLGSGNIDIQGGSGSSLFVAEFGDTSYAEVKDAYDNGDIVVCSFDFTGLYPSILQLLAFDSTNEEFMFGILVDNTYVFVNLSDAYGWEDTSTELAYTDLATTLSDGLMSALDKQKLDGMASLHICQYGSTTFAEALAAIQDGKMLVCVYPDTTIARNVAFLSRINLSSGTPTSFRFTHVVAFAGSNGLSVYEYELHNVSGWSTNEQHLTDYVVAQDTSDGWRYRKWCSGVAECWRSEASRSYAMTQAYGSVYYCNASYSFPSGLSFISAPTVTMTRCGGNEGTGLITASIYGVTATAVNYFVMNPVSATVNCSFAFHCIGRWK